MTARCPPTMLCIYRQQTLHIDGVALERIVDAVGTPCFVYSRAALEANWQSYERAFGARRHRVCYAVKANDNLSVIRTLARLGSGFDIVSGGELERVLAAGADAEDVVFSGVGKTAVEIEQALSAGVGCLNVESTVEVERISAIAERLGRVARLAVRVNPDVDARTHPYISTGLRDNKFGVPIGDATELYRRIAEDPHLQAHGIACHIGSQLTDATPVVEAVSHVVRLAETLAGEGIVLEHVDIGGGLGIRYEDEQPPAVADYIAAVLAVIPERYTVVVEPGRSIAGPAGVLLTRVEYLKRTATRNFVIVDAAMNDLLRPALYDAWHDVLPVRESDEAEARIDCDIVGPVCESGDWLARGRTLAVSPNDVLCIRDTGAYGFVMASNYNARLKPAVVLVEGDQFRVIRSRETIEALYGDERELLED